ncbi:C40 family peptidase [Actinoplanes sp. N902-109]|uniref:C40 family peptidase n=1 Tax=Actinoplanes sp. (strain N902-109) TaxID=649831 RepID=UPI00039F2292|nr:C40 family peptidase [Actinoplanes sp. N902-109]
MSVGTGTAALSLGLCLCAGQLIATPAASAAPVVAVKAAAAAKVTPKVTNSATRTITKGKSVKVTAKVVNPKTGKVVTKGSVRLQALRHGKWYTWTAHSVSSNGTVALTAKPGVTTWFRTQYTGYGTFGYGTSAGIKITVSKPKVATGTKILNEAKKHTGALYKYGASGPSRFDCSGYTKYVYKKAVGKSLPHKANSQQKYGKAVSKGNKKVGDLIIMRSGSYGYHAGIYAGGGYMYDSPHSGARVGKHKIWSSNYVVRRLAA